MRPARSRSPSTALQHQALRQLFTAWVRLLVLKDTVALFGISIDFGGFFFFFKPATKTNSFSQYSLASQLGGKRLLRTSRFQLRPEVLPRGPRYHVT